MSDDIFIACMLAMRFGGLCGLEEAHHLYMHDLNTKIMWELKLRKE